MVYQVMDAHPETIKALIARFDLGYERCCEYDGTIHYRRPRHSYMLPELLVLEGILVLRASAVSTILYLAHDGYDVIVTNYCQDLRYLFGDGVKVVDVDDNTLLVPFFETELGLSLPY